VDARVPVRWDDPEDPSVDPLVGRSSQQLSTAWIWQTRPIGGCFRDRACTLVGGQCPPFIPLLLVPSTDRRGRLQNSPLVKHIFSYIHTYIHMFRCSVSFVSRSSRFSQGIHKSVNMDDLTHQGNITRDQRRRSFC
jgi:hypothetical protein